MLVTSESAVYAVLSKQLKKSPGKPHVLPEGPPACGDIRLRTFWQLPLALRDRRFTLLLSPIVLLEVRLLEGHPVVLPQGRPYTRTSRGTSRRTKSFQPKT